MNPPDDCSVQMSLMSTWGVSVIILGANGSLTPAGGGFFLNGFFFWFACHAILFDSRMVYARRKSGGEMSVKS